ncbi:MAG: acyl-CoA thioesterase [Verrucomicrobiota bacterium]|jgi:acyl-CoA hydrolase|nr:acyl-CoA thioesterase [Verrucomicrobiota bacterium]
MISYKLVMPEHMNHYGVLFGGNLLKWVDETAWMAASLDYPGARFVTIGMDRVEFRKGVSGGSMLRFELERQRVGRTSLTYGARVSRRELHQSEDEVIFSTEITFVRVDENGQKMPVDGKS